MIYDVYMIPQTTGMGCWAASIAMILGWRDQASYSPTMIAHNPGGLNYTINLEHGLDPNDRYILERNGFRTEPPQCYAPQRIADMLADHGPLWVAGYVPLSGLPNPVPHIRVVKGFEGGEVVVNDPWPVNTGAVYRRSFQEFFGRMETLGARESNQPNPVYVAHLA